MLDIAANAGAQANAAAPDADAYCVFWMPGCSSCVRAKEFMTRQGIPFVSMNVSADPAAIAALEKLGAGPMSVPIVSRGDKYVFAQALEDVAEFVGVDVTFERLDPDELFERWFYFLDIARQALPLIPADRLDLRVAPDRPRLTRDLAYHVFQVPEAFLRALLFEEGDLVSMLVPPPPEVKTLDDVAAYADKMTAWLRTWWQEHADGDLDFRVQTFYGPQALNPFLERFTWHTAQHVRQLISVLDGWQIPGRPSIDPDAYTDLPMPAGIWE